MTLTVWPLAERFRLEIASIDTAATSLLSSPPTLDGQRTVGAQAIAIANAHGLDEPPEITDFVVDLLHADSLLDKPSWHFSRGEKQMAGLILAFARPFEWLVLIDPTAGLDGQRVAALAHFLSDYGQDYDLDIATDIEIFNPR